MEENQFEFLVKRVETTIAKKTLLWENASNPTKWYVKEIGEETEENITEKDKSDE